MCDCQKRRLRLNVMAGRIQRTPEFRRYLGRYNAKTFGLPRFVRVWARIWARTAPVFVASASRMIMAAVLGMFSSCASEDGGQTRDALLRQRIGNGFQRFAFSVDTEFEFDDGGHQQKRCGDDISKRHMP
jgi:hypothetical protein